MDDASGTLDPVTLAVLKGRLEQIADEMDATLFRAPSTQSSPRRMMRATGIYDARTGDTLVQGKARPADLRRRDVVRREAR